ncbi:hypothetical protein P7K49_010367 [Saguinus oedipus]|uniref:Cation-transporting P-type ATPase N-terminal domain-containing protein n=1 Tax=Saguinus oedipus TaxID=9490 RepID=A0ABQ9VML7_SAGOE|nr:hypothetical protein P7K49_010367 [Saguinus oedipus]
MEAAHLLPAADVLRHFSVTAEGGLSPEQVTEARERYGPNAGPRAPQAQFPLLSPAAERSSPHHPALGPRGRAGRKRGLRKPLRMLLRHRGCAATFAGSEGWGWVPAWETRRLVPPAPGTSRTSHLHHGPVNPASVFHPILDRTPPPRRLAPAGILQVLR